MDFLIIVTLFRYSIILGLCVSLNAAFFICMYIDLNQFIVWNILENLSIRILQVNSHPAFVQKVLASEEIATYQ